MRYFCSPLAGHSNLLCWSNFKSNSPINLNTKENNSPFVIRLPTNAFFSSICRNITFLPKEKVDAVIPVVGVTSFTLLERLRYDNHYL